MSDFIGIDLGTSNCAIARVGDSSHPENLPLTQAITASSEGEKSLLPSAIYMPAEGEFPESSSTQILGLFARDRGALQPDRLIVSAKSWLCHPHADRRGPILPWASTTVDFKLSPLDASRDLLAHLLASLKNSHPNLVPTHPVIT
ncbi:MAG: molecular chaperone DnaK, partial [Spartobacteria bacterium]